MRIATGVDNPFLSLYLGQQRIGGDLVDRGRSERQRHRLCRAGATCRAARTRSTSASRRTRERRGRATCARSPTRRTPRSQSTARAVLGFLYQQVTGPRSGPALGDDARADDGRLRRDDELRPREHAGGHAGEAASIPYLGDYLYMMAVGSAFYGIFSADNTPDVANFPNGVTYQRNANFATKTLLDSRQLDAGVGSRSIRSSSRWGRPREGS